MNRKSLKENKGSLIYREKECKRMPRKRERKEGRKEEDLIRNRLDLMEKGPEIRMERSVMEEKEMRHMVRIERVGRMRRNLDKEEIEKVPKERLMNDLLDLKDQLKLKKITLKLRFKAHKQVN